MLSNCQGADGSGQEDCEVKFVAKAAAGIPDLRAKKAGASLRTPKGLVDFALLLWKRGGFVMDYREGEGWCSGKWGLVSDSFGGVMPVGEGGGGDGGLALMDNLEVGEEGAGLVVEAEGFEGEEDAGDAEPVVVGDFEEVVAAGGGADFDDLAFLVGEAEEVEEGDEGGLEVVLELGLLVEGDDVVVVEDGGGWVMGAGGGEGEHPLNEVVDVFHAVVVEALGVVEGTAASVSPLAGVVKEDGGHGGRS